MNSKFNLDNYVPVHERLKAFYEAYPDGRIHTEILQLDAEKGFVLVKASIYRTLLSSNPAATGHAFEERAIGFVNKTSYIENAETSAVGRALALMGYEITRGIASREEMEKVERMSVNTEVTRTANGYEVNGHSVRKPNGKIICDCGLPNCVHIALVREYVNRDVSL